MAVVRDCEFCGSRGCRICITLEDMLQLRHNALSSQDDGSSNVEDLVTRRAAENGVYPADDPRNRQAHKPREVDADCVRCSKPSVIQIIGVGYFCTECQAEQPTEFTDCVFCDLRSAVKEPDKHRCLLCGKEQPQESNVLPFGAT